MQYKITTGIRCTVLLLLVGLFSLSLCIGPIQARYNNSTTLSVIYGRETTSRSTLTEEKTIYDFGCWNRGESDDFSHTIVLADSVPLEGELRFTWDEETATKPDIAVHIEGIAGANGIYNIQESNGCLEIPFSLIFTSTTRVGFATLDVEWVPTDAEKATRSARYLMTLNPDSAVPADAIALSLNENTGFVSNDLWQLSLNVPTTVAGVILSPGQSLSNEFAAGTIYYTDAYPQGVVLLRTSAIALPSENSSVNALIVVGEHATNEPMNITVGIFGRGYGSTSQTPTTALPRLTVTLSDPAALVSHTQSLTVTLTEPNKLHDSAWNTAGNGSADLTWRIERLVDGQYHLVTPDEHLTVTPTQTDNGGSLVIAAPTGGQSAGTYRLTLTQTYNGYSINSTVVWFFIDYR